MPPEPATMREESTMKSRFPCFSFTLAVVLTAGSLGRTTAAHADVALPATGNPEVLASADAATPSIPAASCTMAPGAIGTTAFFWTPPEELTSVAWKIPTSSCTTCGPNPALSLTSASFRMRWFRACSATAQISIIGASQGDTCMVPDTSRVLCGPITQPFAPVGNGNVLYTVPIPNGCCISGDAFLYIKFTGLGACATTVGPGLTAAQAPCTPCVQYVSALNIFANTTEWCSIGASGPMWFSINADCCSMTPTREGSWGSLKTLYR